MPGPYEGVHGFVFLYADDANPPEGVIENLREHVNKKEGPVFFASLFDGDFAGFAHFAADGLLGLVNFTGSELFDAGVEWEKAFGIDANPAMSPMTPPPKVTTVDARSAFARTSAS